jgi:hypothetical protein
MSRWSRRVALAAVTVLVSTAIDLPAQPRASIWLGPTGTALWTRTAVPGSITGLSGTLFGGEGRLLAGPVAVRLGYAEGSASTGPIRRDHVEGFLFVGFRPVPGLAIGGGPHAIAYSTDTTSERWLEWQVRGRYDAPLVDHWVNAYLDLWLGVAGSAGAVGQFGGGRGGGAGVEVRLGKTPLVARLGYQIGESKLEAGARRETTEGVTLGVGWSR